jgi:DtxR family Mn-dependent transcriptional regulator
MHGAGNFLVYLVSPLWQLIYLAAALALIGLIAWPNQGLWARFGKMRSRARRAMMEDVLKCVFDCAYKRMDCQLNTVAGRLKINPDEAAKLLERLTEMGLCRQLDQNFLLTDAGRAYALRIIRIHRIWEKYLANETGMLEKHWHADADKKEHILTPEAANLLASSMGNPVFDPHGDPIPARDGSLPGYKARSLNTLHPGDKAIVVHLEDEPQTMYNQLVSLGLYPGMALEVKQVSEERMSLWAEGTRLEMSALFASNVAVELLDDDERITQKRYPALSTLRPGESARVVGIAPGCRGQQRRRLMDMGIVPGTPIQAIMKSPSGDPVGYHVMGTTVGIRRQQAEQILIEKQGAMHEE